MYIMQVAFDNPQFNVIENLFLEKELDECTIC